ncbi:dynein light chain tctex-type 1 protein (macronuclear) [Tetrahymena thermophila SB210]|uniref:Dynein light chain tctex-type 1 protein n=2 Tax=Tetrahymena thermophila TaxID=5911 RepID=I7MGG2_TETTS|nr:dynein light chain tctex-type 1 protein [Tetrahymena thermophila SB210]ABF50906.1 dynein light chain Tctex1A [Tetrahymena thermophila]EAR85130.1 dynein light chain tctex-type 1 protein [Tetrahymena thermophila SB210]|eukprot:XP_001032793.1 dynein light chain tctex-type 1 protein [Tetrahymena thermophila SB210]
MEEVIFNNLKNQINDKALQIIKEKIDKKSYNSNDAQRWTNQLCDDVLKFLTTLNKNFKFIVNCMIMQKSDAGLHISGSCYWDNEIDGSLVVKYETNSIVCIMNIFGCAL